MRNKAVVAIILGLSGSLTVCSAETAPFGAASAYNAVALTGNITYNNDFTGRIAADGNITGGGTIGDNLRTPALDPFGSLGGAYDYAMVAGGNINAGANVNAGGSVYATNGVNGVSIANENGYAVNPVIGTTPPTPFPFAALTASIDLLTEQLARLQSNGTICQPIGSAGCLPGANGNPSWLVLNAGSTVVGTYVFNVSAAQFAGGDNLDINVPPGSTVIINVATSGVTNYTLNAGVYVNGQQQNVNLNGALNTTQILFNFPDAVGANSSVSLDAELVGAVLAPFTTLDINNQVGGTFLAGSINTNGETHYFAFDGNLPTPPSSNTAVTPEPATMLLMGTGILYLAVLMRRRLRA